MESAMLEWRMTEEIHLQSSPSSISCVWEQQPATVGYFSGAAESKREDDDLLPVSQEAPDHTEPGGEVVWPQVRLTDTAAVRAIIRDM